MIKATSHSRLSIYEECPQRAKLAFVHKIPEPDRPPLPEGKEYPNDRGSRIHLEAENFIKGAGGFTPDLKHFKLELEKLAQEYAKTPESILLEQMWCFNDAWEPVPWNAWNDVWVRVKCDAVYFPDPSEAYVVDYKTGKRFGNEVKHKDQELLYAIGAFFRFPELEKVTTELWYFDLDEITSTTYTRKQAMRFLPPFNERFKRMTTDHNLEAKPSKHTCFFCPYKTGLIGKLGPEGTGHCKLNPDSNK